MIFEHLQSKVKYHVQKELWFFALFFFASLASLICVGFDALWVGFISVWI